MAIQRETMDEALANAMQHQDKRNVVDWFKGMDDADIRADLDSRRGELIVATENVASDFHKGNILRTVEGFNAGIFQVIGRKSLDTRACVGTQKRLPPEFYKHYRDFEIPEGYRVVTCDNIPGAVSMWDYEFQPKTLMIFGEEHRGVTQDAIDLADDVVYVPMFGAVRSFSVSTAAGMMIGEYMRQMHVRGLIPSEQ